MSGEEETKKPAAKRAKKAPASKEKTSTASGFEFDPQMNPEDLPDTSGPIPEGWRRFCVTKARLGKSQGGNDMLSNRYTVIGRDDDYEGRHLRDWIVYTRSRNGFGKLAAFCQAIDPGMVSHSRDPENGFNHQDQDSIDYHVLGQVFQAKIEHESDSYTDRSGKRVEKVRERIVEFRAISDQGLATLEADYGGEPRPPLPDDANEDWPKKGGGFGDSSGGGGGRGKRDGFSDDDIPF